MPGVRVDDISGEVGSQGRERLLDAAVRLIAREGIDNVRIARIATEAGVSAGLVHYHFASRDALLEEALEHSYERAGDLRLAALEAGRATAAQRLAAMIDQCLPTDRALHDDFVLWIELWLRSARDPALRPVAARLYARLHAWFAQAIADGIASGELHDCDVEAMTDRLLALIDGYGIRVLDRRSAHAARARSRRDLGRDRARPRPLVGSAGSSQQRFALGLRQRSRSAVRPGGDHRRPGADHQRAAHRLDRLARAHPGRRQPVEHAAHHDLGVAARGHVTQVGAHMSDLQSRGPGPARPGARRATPRAPRPRR